MMCYTKLGDSGYTCTFDGQKIRKDDCLVEVVGKIDSLQGQIDKVMYFLNEDYLDDIKLKKELKKINDNLSKISSGVMGCRLSDEITKLNTSVLECRIDILMPKIKCFIRFSKIVTIELNEARVRTREIERALAKARGEVSKEIFTFFNRLSDYFFALSANIEIGGKDEQRSLV